jgi:hypothetical protein
LAVDLLQGAVVAQVARIEIALIPTEMNLRQEAVREDLIGACGSLPSPLILGRDCPDGTAYHPKDQRYIFANQHGSAALFLRLKKVFISLVKGVCSLTSQKYKKNSKKHKKRHFFGGG